MTHAARPQSVARGPTAWGIFPKFSPRNWRNTRLAWLGLAVLISGCNACSETVRGAGQPTEPQRPAGEPSTGPAGSVAAGSTEQELLPPEEPPAGAEDEFTTDFSRHTVPYDEILSGGPPKDGIPAVDAPKFVELEAADEWLSPREPVVQVQVEDEVKAYPIQILMFHEIVNDTVGGKPLLVSFCPLCNTALAFERAVDGAVLDFGATGRLRNSNLIVYDRQTETWWQQATGRAIAGKMTGRTLKPYPAQMVAWRDFKAWHPDGTVLSRDTGHQRPYGHNPYAGYDDIRKPPFLFRGDTPDTLPPVARVLAVDRGGRPVAYPYEVLKKKRVINDRVGEVPVVVMWASGTASALDEGTVSGGRDVGSATAYERQHEGKTLQFEVKDGHIVDRQTGSRWSERGRAVGGALEGARLEPVVAVNHFWFSWAAFKPDTRVYQP